MKDTVIVILCCVTLFSVLMQYRIYLKICELFFDTEDRINHYFDKFFKKQEGLLKKKYWDTLIKQVVTLDTELYNHIDYNLNKQQMEALFDAFLTGRYDLKIEDTLGTYCQCILGQLCDDYVADENIINKYSSDVKRRCIIREIPLIQLGREKIIKLFDNEAVIPNQYVFYSLSNENVCSSYCCYDAINKEEFLKVYAYFHEFGNLYLHFDTPESFFDQLTALYKFLCHSRFYQYKNKYGMEYMDLKDDYYKVLDYCFIEYTGCGSMREFFEDRDENSLRKFFVVNSESQSKLLAIQANLKKGETIKSVLEFRAKEDAKRIEEDMLSWANTDIFADFEKELQETREEKYNNPT